MHGHGGTIYVIHDLTRIDIEVVPVGYRSISRVPSLGGGQTPSVNADLASTEGSKGHSIQCP
jgi:hypothetical protein